jgi:hypothetical protein
MTIDEMAVILQQLFGDQVQSADGTWQIELPQFRLLVLLSEDHSWVRVLVPIVTASDAAPFLEQLMAANFDYTLEARYALHQDVLWGVFQHSLAGLTQEDFTVAIERLTLLHKRGLDDCFSELVEQRVQQIIRAAKQQGQSLEATLQTLDRFYQEGLMGDMALGSQSRDDTLAAWRYQLERLWNDPLSDTSA